MINRSESELIARERANQVRARRGGRKKGVPRPRTRKSANPRTSAARGA